MKSRYLKYINLIVMLFIASVPVLSKVRASQEIRRISLPRYYCVSDKLVEHIVNGYSINKLNTCILHIQKLNESNCVLAVNYVNEKNYPTTQDIDMSLYGCIVHRRCTIYLEGDILDTLFREEGKYKTVKLSPPVEQVELDDGIMELFLVKSSVIYIFDGFTFKDLPDDAIFDDFSLSPDCKR